MESVLAKKDVLALMPTGGGKSLCYQLPAMIQPGLTLVVSPLLALMNDQVAAMKKLGLPAGAVHSGMTEDERKEVFRQLKNSEHFILYVSPERVQKTGFGPWLEKQNLSLIAIDEAHCVSQWGHDFRKDYTQLSKLRTLKPDVPMIGLTATATPLVKNDIIEQLSLKEPDEHVYGFYRPNLYYQVDFSEEGEEKESYVLSAVKKTPLGRIIIYCGTRKKTEEWFTALSRAGEKVGFYHAGLAPEERNNIEKAYARGEIRVLCATNAFGMGIDHPDVRMVIHTQMPGNIESYYQEVGRAGRDGEKSTCLLTYSKKDKGLQSFFINQSKASKRIKTQRWAALEAMVQYCEGSECRHADILTYFKDTKRIDKCGHCDTCDPDSIRRVLPVLKLKPKKTVKKLAPKKTALFEPGKMSEEQEWRNDELRLWRREYAKEHDMPAFMVFSDKTLKDLVMRAPKTKADLAKVYGLGEKKIEAIGDIILDLLK